MKKKLKKETLWKPKRKVWFQKNDDDKIGSKVSASEEADKSWEKLSPRKKALAQEGLYDY